MAVNIETSSTAIEIDRITMAPEYLVLHLVSSSFSLPLFCIRKIQELCQVNYICKAHRRFWKKTAFFDEIKVHIQCSLF